MFDVSFSELILIGVVALIVIGPERLPKVARTIGHLVGRAQRYVNDVKSDIQREMDIEELGNLKGQMEDAAKAVKSSVEEAGNSIRKPVDEAQAAIAQAADSLKTIATPPSTAEPSKPADPHLPAPEPSRATTPATAAAAKSSEGTPT